MLATDRIGDLISERTFRKRKHQRKHHEGRGFSASEEMPELFFGDARGSFRAGATEGVELKILHVHLVVELPDPPHVEGSPEDRWTIGKAADGVQVLTHPVGDPDETDEAVVGVDEGNAPPSDQPRQARPSSDGEVWLDHPASRLLESPVFAQTSVVERSDPRRLRQYVE